MGTIRPLSAKTAQMVHDQIGYWVQLFAPRGIKDIYSASDEGKMRSRSSPAPRRSLPPHQFGSVSSPGLAHRVRKHEAGANAVTPSSHGRTPPRRRTDVHLEDPHTYPFLSRVWTIHRSRDMRRGRGGTGIHIRICDAREPYFLRLEGSAVPAQRKNGASGGPGRKAGGGRGREPSRGDASRKARRRGAATEPSTLKGYTISEVERGVKEEPRQNDMREADVGIAGGRRGGDGEEDRKQDRRQMIIRDAVEHMDMSREDWCTKDELRRTMRDDSGAPGTKDVGSLKSRDSAERRSGHTKGGSSVCLGGEDTRMDDTPNMRRREQGRRPILSSHPTSRFTIGRNLGKKRNPGTRSRIRWLTGFWAIGTRSCALHPSHGPNGTEHSILLELWVSRRNLIAEADQVRQKNPVKPSRVWCETFGRISKGEGGCRQVVLFSIGRVGPPNGLDLLLKRRLSYWCPQLNFPLAGSDEVKVANTPPGRNDKPRASWAPH
ncbi:hypothetical protein K438DRAFT_1772780 [Mycena galopus ATCC 62051]|nr:hypothetical protein K438DRAFT_1772780 [Mycena galopus ATCC 62051]